MRVFERGMNMKHKTIYGGKTAEVELAAGTRGMLIRTLDSDLMFRVYHDHKSFTDYEIRHDDIAVTIANDELASFYRMDDKFILDHSPEVLGLKRVQDDQ